MSNSCGIYILGTNDGFRVGYGAHLEKLTKDNIEFFHKCPTFMEIQPAIAYAGLVEQANPNEYGIMILDYRDFNFNDFRRKS